MAKIFKVVGLGMISSTIYESWSWEVQSSMDEEWKCECRGGRLMRISYWGVEYQRKSLDIKEKTLKGAVGSLKFERFLNLIACWTIFLPF